MTSPENIELPVLLACRLEPGDADASSRRVAPAPGDFLDGADLSEFPLRE